MGIPVSVTFHRLERSKWIEADIRKRAARLARYCRFLRSVRAVVDVPHRHSPNGSRFRLHIELVVPNEPIAVTRDAALGAPARDLAFVIRDAFAVARRRVQDYHRRHHLAVKRYSLPTVTPRRAARRRVVASDGKRHDRELGGRYASLGADD